MPVIIAKHGSEILVDQEDFEYLSQFSWVDVQRSETITYVDAYIQELGRRLGMHRILMKAKAGQIVDHKDGNGLNNQKDNLRIATHQQNMQNCKMKKNNTLGFKGVQLKPSGRYSARIRNSDGQRLYLGTYDTPIEASLVYNEAAKQHFGEFACP